MTQRNHIEFIIVNSVIMDLHISSQFDVREDEEQNVKLGQTIDLLLAAGYFRARIKGLSPFDKVCNMYYMHCTCTTR